MTKRLITFQLLLFLVVGIYAQKKITYALNADKTVISASVDLNKKQLESEDAANEKNGMPVRVAILAPMSTDVESAGKWSIIDDKSNSWKLTIDAKNSYGVIVRFSEFYIPKGGKLYVYDPENAKYTQLFTDEQNPINNAYSVETLTGEQLVLEYVAPTSTTEKPRFTISEIGYKYRDLNEGFYLPDDSKTKALNHSANSCMLNVNCSEAKKWKNQAKGVVRLRTKVGTDLYACTASIVNNTAKDKTPYILSAYHCFSINNVSADVSATEFFFFYETSGCENESTEPSYKLIVGNAEMLVLDPINNGSDAALLKLLSPFPDDWDIYYNGWNRENINNNFSNGAVIHHPQGDVKKISFYTKPLETSTYSDRLYTSATNAHWKVTYSSGSTSGGSSGAPIFNQAGLIVGTLTGGDSKCVNTVGDNSPDYYGKFYYHWDQMPSANQQLKTYLDPLNLNPTQLLGMDANGNSPTPAAQPNFIAFVTDGEIHVQATNGLITYILITDLNNRVLYKKRGFDTSAYTIPFSSSWPSGVYLITIESEEGLKESMKIIK